jgi:hypothetical protein
VAEEKILIVPAEVVRKIEENRGNLSQGEFLVFLMDSPRHGESLAERFVTRDAFQEFEREMKELMRSFLDFFISYGLELGRRPGSGKGEALSRGPLHSGTRSGNGSRNGSTKEAKGQG